MPQDGIVLPIYTANLFNFCSRLEDSYLPCEPKAGLCSRMQHISSTRPSLHSGLAHEHMQRKWLCLPQSWSRLSVSRGREHITCIHMSWAPNKAESSSENFPSVLGQSKVVLLTISRNYFHETPTYIFIPSYICTVDIPYFVAFLIAG